MAESFETLFDNIKSKLSAYSATQAAASQFTVVGDKFRGGKISAKGADAFVYLNNLNQTGRTTNGRWMYDATYYVDLIVQQAGSLDGSDYTRASEVAGARLRTLVSQCMTALFATGERTVGLSSDEVSTKDLESVAFLEPDQVPEEGVQAARMTIKVGLEWAGTAISGTDLERIDAVVGEWSATIEP